MSNVIQFPIGETQRNAQRESSERFVRGLRGNVETAGIINFPRNTLAESRTMIRMLAGNNADQYGRAFPDLD